MLFSIALIFTCGLTLGSIFQKLRLPSLLGMLATGIVLGPFVLDLIDPSILNISVDIRQAALIIILLKAGLSLDLNDLKQVGRPAILMCFVPACFEIIGMVLLAPKLLGVSILDAAIMGTVVAAVSPAVVVPRMLRLLDERYGNKNRIPQLIMAGASVDDVFVIVLFTSFTALAGGANISVFSFAGIPISFLLGILGGAVCGLLLSLFFKKIHMRDSVKILILLSICFLFVTLEKAVESTVPFSGLLAVMALGITLLKIYPKLANRISSKFSKMWVAAEVILFALVGATVDVSYTLSAGLSAIVLVFAVLIFRMTGVFVCLIKTPLSMKERLFCMIAYTPKATVQAAIGGLPLAMGLDCGQVVLTVAVISILLTAPLGAFGIDVSYKKLLEKK